MNCQRCGGDGNLVREIWGFNVREYVAECPDCAGEGLEQCHACGNTDINKDLKLPDKKNDGYFDYFCSNECIKEYLP